MNTCLYANELDSYACRVYRKHWNDGTLHQEDIRNVTAGDVCRRGVPDVICGGFPCTDLSMSGGLLHQRDGLAGDESGLVNEMSRLIHKVMPRWIVVENVTALRQYEDEVRQLFQPWDMRFFDVEMWWYGAYTRRKRTIVIGHLRGIGECPIHSLEPEIKPRFETDGQPDTLPMCLPWKGGVTLERLGACVIENPKTDAERMRASDGIPRRLDACRWLAVGNSVSPLLTKYIAQRLMAHHGGEFTFAELFAGIGGFRLGFEMASGRV